MSSIVMKPTVEVNGRLWHLFDVEFDSPDGKYCVYLYALSNEHAHMQLADLKENGRIGGQIIDVIQE